MADQQDMMRRHIQATQRAYRDLGSDEGAAIEAWEEMLPCRDGVRLRTMFFRPKGATAPLPTVVQRSCYPHMEAHVRAHAQGYCGLGFAFIVQWCRGTGGSQGEWRPNENERNDGEDFLTYLQSTDWVGNIGYLGSSYLALTGWAIADIVPPKVRTMYLTQYGTDRFTSAYMDGLFRHDVLTGWAMENAGYPVTADYMESCRYRPHNRVDEALWGAPLPWYRAWIENTSPSDAYWQEGFWGLLAGIPQRVRIPLHIAEGWYDHHLGSALVSYASLSPQARAHSTLRIGCWDHMFRPCMQDRETHRLENDDTRSAVAWFTRLLKREELPDARISLYQIGEDRWIDYGPYPPAPTARQRLHFGENGALSDMPPIADAIRAFHYDPENPVPSHGTEAMLTTGREQGSLLQPDMNHRPDVVSFLSEPYNTEQRIVGSIRVGLRVSSDAEDTAFTAKIMEVFPDGRAYNIRSGITTLAYRGHSDVRQPYAPGSDVDAPIDLWDIAWTVQAGSRLRVDISSSDFPQYALHSNHAGIWSAQEETKVARQMLHLAGCYIDLPLL
ncbi:CocE/NonD family hydrolase [Eubacteriales bacterium OttesenSCG-928-A19]|nr:CocE/NonD family hydrolase [Eubacteriales bacterium OttesenSCG-928-A19]